LHNYNLKKNIFCYHPTNNNKTKGKITYIHHGQLNEYLGTVIVYATAEIDMQLQICNDGKKFAD